jgi:glucose-6-phosphate isomerase
VLHDGGSSLEVSDNVTSGDYLAGFLHGTRRALYENGRESITITVNRVDAATIGRLIALYERAVGLYGFMVNVNAYHQPGVEAGKKAAKTILDLQAKVLQQLQSQPGSALTASEIAQQAGVPDEVESVFHLLRHLAANNRVTRVSSGSPKDATYSIK